MSVVSTSRPLEIFRRISMYIITSSCLSSWSGYDTILMSRSQSITLTCVYARHHFLKRKREPGRVLLHGQQLTTVLHTESSMSSKYCDTKEVTASVFCVRSGSSICTKERINNQQLYIFECRRSSSSLQKHRGSGMCVFLNFLSRSSPCSVRITYEKRVIYIDTCWGNLLVIPIKGRQPIVLACVHLEEQNLGSLKLGLL